MRGEPRVIARKARLSVVVGALPEGVRRGKCGSAVGYVLVRARSLSSGFGFAGVGVPSSKKLARRHAPALVLFRDAAKSYLDASGVFDLSV